MHKRKIISHPGLYGVAQSPVRTLPRRTNRPRPWLLLVPGIAVAIIAAWLDLYIGRPLLLALLIPAAIFLSPVYSHRISLYLVYLAILATYVYAAHLFGFCC